jgi:RNA polymerase sigma factor (sigma-70 family)
MAAEWEYTNALAKNMAKVASSGSEGASTLRSAANPREVEWVLRVAQGDRQAFELLYRDYFPRLARFLAKMTRRPDLVEEILNDTMMVVSQKAHMFDRSAKVSTWIFAIAYRKGLHALREMHEPMDRKHQDLAGDSCAEPGDELMQLQLRKVLSEAVNALSVDHRAVVELTYFQGVGYREIAQIMDCPIDTVKTRMFHARRRLKALLPDRLEDVL